MDLLAQGRATTTTNHTAGCLTQRDLALDMLLATVPRWAALGQSIQPEELTRNPSRPTARTEPPSFEGLAAPEALEEVLSRFSKPDGSWATSIAVVGSSGNLLSRGYGGSIDSHDIVVRVNGASEDGYEADAGRDRHQIVVGWKTGLRDAFNRGALCCGVLAVVTSPLQAAVRSGHNGTFPNEAQGVANVTVYGSFMLDALAILQAADVQHHVTSEKQGEEAQTGEDTPMWREWARRNRAGPARSSALAAQESETLDDRSWPSTGFLAIVLAVAVGRHIGANVSVYGFGACSTCNKFYDCDGSNSSAFGTADWLAELEGVDSFHPFATEALVRQQWAEKGMISLHEDPCAEPRRSEMERAQAIPPSAVDERPPQPWLVAHHRSDWELGARIAETLRRQLNVSVQGPDAWFGQPFVEQPSLQRVLEQKACHGCLSPWGSTSRGTAPAILRREDRIVNMVRDPLALVLSEYEYHLFENSTGAMRFADGGERGGDLEFFLDADRMRIYGLPAATPLDEFPSYLRALTAKQGLLAEMLRVISWELPEMLASVAAVRTSSAFTNVCLDGLLADQRMFDASISDLLDALGVHATTAALPDLSAIYVRDHHLAAATRRQLSEDMHRFDEIHFDGFFRDASRFVREATRCEWSWIS